MNIGAKNPEKLANMFVMPIKVPAKFGAISMWLQLMELNWNPLKPTVKHNKATTSILSQPAYLMLNKQIAGITKAVKKKKSRENHLTVTLKIELVIT